jgi:hypothetical protein
MGKPTLDHFFPDVILTGSGQAARFVQTLGKMWSDEGILLLNT